MPKREPPKAGDAFEIPYPFVRDTFTENYADEEGVTENQVPTWRPGIRDELLPPDGGHQAVADGMGAQIVTVVGVFKPGKFPTRVFYTRQWRDPDGKVFGKSNCQIKTIHAWWNLLNGFRVDFWLNDEFHRRWHWSYEFLAEATPTGAQIYE